MMSSLDGIASTRVASVPPPRRAWRTRIGLPLAILLASGALIGGALVDALVPAVEVEGTAVVLASIGSEGATGAHDAHAAHDGEGASSPDAPGVPSGPTIQAAGWIEPSPFAVFATALADGVVEEVLILEGDRVSAGDVLVRLVDADARLALQRARAELARADGSLVRARAALESVIDADRARAVAQARLQAADAAIVAFEAERVAARSALIEVEEELARKRPLVESGAVAAIEIRRLELRLDAQRATVEALTARRGALDAARAEAEAEWNAARRGRELLIEERAAVALAEADQALARATVETAELALSRTEIRSPIDGVVLERLVAPGMRVAPDSEDGGRTVALFDPARLQVRADVPNADIALVGVGQRAEITIEALPNAIIRGTVDRITARADIAKNTVQAKIILIDPPATLRPDMLCRVRIGGSGASADQGTRPQSSARQRVFAPQDLLDGSTAIVADAPREGLARAQRRALVLGEERRGGWIEVVEGLRPGEILLPPRAVTEGTRVKVLLSRSSTEKLP